MSKRNKELIEKATVKTTTGGQLSPEQATKFISTVVSESEFLKKIHVQPMDASTYNIDLLGIAGRQMRAAVEDTAPSGTATVTLPRRTLVTKEVILPYDVSVNFLEENISKTAAEAQLNKAFADQFGNDLLDLSCIGDESSVDDFVKINDGWITIALADGDTHKVNISGVTSPKAIFKSMLAAMPSKYKRDKSKLVFLVDPAMEEAYREELGERATAMGDAYLTENRKAYYQGVAVEAVPYWKNRNPMLTIYDNLWIGIGRNISSDREKKPRKRVYEYTITAKTDANYAVSGLIVIGHDA